MASPCVSPIRYIPNNSKHRSAFSAFSSISEKLFTPNNDPLTVCKMEKIPLVKADIVPLDNSCEDLVTALKTLDLGDNQTTYKHRKLKKTNSNKIGNSISIDLQ